MTNCTGLHHCTTFNITIDVRSSHGVSGKMNSFSGHTVTMVTLSQLLTDEEYDT